MNNVAFMITVAGLTRRFGTFTAVDNVSFDIPAGQIVGLLGHNGAGKTTIMKMLTGFLEPSAGSICINGNAVGSIGGPSAANDIGYLPESLPVYPELTVADYLDYVAELRGVTAQAKPLAIGQVVRQTHLTEKITQTIGTLSRGYRQRVGVAQALLAKPRLLILDEPTNGLDPMQILHMRALIKGLSQQATVVLSTHILQEVKAVCDRVLILRNGRLVLDDMLSQLDGGLCIRLKTDASQTQLEQLYLKSSSSPLSTLVQSVRLKSEEENQIKCYELNLCSHHQSATDYQQVTADIAQAMVTADYRLFALEQVHSDLDHIFHAVNAERDIDDRTATYGG